MHSPKSQKSSERPAAHIDRLWQHKRQDVQTEEKEGTCVRRQEAFQMEVWQAELHGKELRGCRESKWETETMGDIGRDNDDDDDDDDDDGDDGDLAVCLEINLQLPAIRLGTRAAEHNVCKWNQLRLAAQQNTVQLQTMTFKKNSVLWRESAVQQNTQKMAQNK